LQGLSAAFGVVLKSIGLFAGLVNPVTLVVAAIAGAGVAAYTFKDQIGAALGSVAPYVQEAAGAIGQGFTTAIADAQVVLGDLYATATTTFNGIYDAIAAGDISGAMDVLWAGLVAGWLRGSEAIMSYVDPWIATFQNAFTILGAEIFKAWDGLWVMVGNALNVAGAYLKGTMDNVINGVLAAWDYMEAGIRKTWIRVSGLFSDAATKQAELDKVDQDMRDRAEKRAKDRPGIIGRLVTAGSQNAEANMALQDRQAAIDANTQQVMQGRIDATGLAAGDRRAATMAAEQRLADLVNSQANARTESEQKTATVTRDQVDQRARKSQADDLLAAIRGATNATQLTEVGGLQDQFETLRDLGRLTSQQESLLADELTKAGDRVRTPDTRMKAETIGTFSSMALGQMFGGNSIAEQTLKATQEVAKNTRKIGDGDKVAA
jgi:hypothetical protein